MQTSVNPLLEPWTAPFGMPPADRVQPEHFAPAFEAALAEHLREIEAIATATAPASFENTCVALDAGGQRLSGVLNLFSNLGHSHTSPALQALERDWRPRISAHLAAVARDERLYARLDTLWRAVDTLGLDGEQRRLLERQRHDARLEGAHLDATARARLAQIVERESVLTTAFAQNVLAEEQQCLWLTADDLDGLADDLRAAAREAARERGRPEAWAILLSRSMVVPFLTQATRRPLRERAHRMWKGRGRQAGPQDNRPLIRELLQLRREQAQLLGFASFADYALSDRMAGTPQAVADLLQKVWTPACARARAEEAELARLAQRDDGTGTIEAWDWRYYAERLRREHYALDERELKPYFTLEAMMAALFGCAERLFGVRFVPRTDLPVYHPDVLAYEAQAADGAPIGVFLFDHYARPTKRSGAWMSMLRMQSRGHGTALPAVLPIVLNNCNFARPPAGSPLLLSQDDVRTLFHEFGHGLHGLLSNVRYRRLAGTQVLRDFVELPSQLFEHWALEPTVLAQYARHVDTGAPIPAPLIDKLLAARAFNQGFETVGYTASALVDMALHAHPDPTALDLDAFERDTLTALGMPHAIAPYHHLPHFQHLFAGGYAAGYYVYLWAEVLDADGFQAFREAGDPFDAATARRLLQHIYSSGNAVEPRAAYRAFRGRDAKVEPLLAKRGLLPEAA
jgi:peptidyl-dipeptidase Dcp